MAEKPYFRPDPNRPMRAWNHENRNGKRLPERVRDPHRKSAEIAVAGEQLADAVLDAQRRDVGVMDQIARDCGLSNDGGHDFAVPLGLGKENERWRRKDLIQIMESDGERNGGRKHPRVRNNSKKLINTGPWNRPRNPPLGKFRQQKPGRAMVGGRNDFRVDEDVCVDGLHVSAAIHQVKELVSIEQIHTGLFDCLPAAKREPRLALWPLLDESLSEEIVGHSLERPPLPYGLLLDSFQQVIVNCERRPTHASKCIVCASRCQ